MSNRLPKSTTWLAGAAATYELKRQRQLAALRAATGAWKLADHPELKGGSVAYQRKLRAESERRLKRQTARSARA